MGQGAVVSEAVAKEAAAAREKAVEKPAAVQRAEEVAAAIPEAALKPASKVRLQCRVEGCPFTAPSPTAMCPIHPGKLVSL